jgi:hypothetical protein
MVAAQKLRAGDLVQQTLKRSLAQLVVFCVNIRALGKARFRLNLRLNGVIKEGNFTDITDINTFTWFK